MDYIKSMFFGWIAGIGSSFGELNITFPDIFTCAVRWLFPLLALVILYRLAVSLLKWQKEPEVWAYLTLPTGTRIPVMHWENLIGRAKNSDIRLNYPTVSRSHAVLTRSDDGIWTVSDVGSKGGVYINGEETGGEIDFGDVITLGGVDMILIDVPEEELIEDSEYRTKPGRVIKPSTTFFLITLFQMLAAMQLIISYLPELEIRIPIAFSALCVIMWLYFIVIRALKRTGFEIEGIAFFLTTLGMAVIASSDPSELYKQLAAVVMGIVVFLALGVFMRDLDRTKKIRWLMAAAGIGLFLFNLIFGKEVYGAKNWIFIGSLSFQPSELIKICFIFAGAATLDRLMSKRNLILFIVFSGFCCGALALMNDLGTALVYFAAFVVIAFLRSGDFATISLICAGTGFAGLMAIRLKPHATARFAAWRHVWDYVYESGGYQQTRTMMSIASGGLVGLGAGNGWLKYVGASDTDLVFGFVAEEWGLIIAVVAVLCIVCLAVFTVKSAAVGRSSFYVIASCSAMCMLMVQMLLNVFGSVDILPLTGVTFPFVSNGGSSMIASWGLLAFVKAADTRQNASFAIKLPTFEGGEE